MENLVVVAIRYNKRSGEYTVKYRDGLTGETVTASANRLKNSEIDFSRGAKHYREDNERCIWC